MITPTHCLKKFVKYKGNEKPASSYITDTVGWLGSGLVDCNGVEIYEGDIVQFACADDNAGTAVVNFYRGEFRANDMPIGGFGNDIFKIVGHVATEEQA